MHILGDLALRYLRSFVSSSMGNMLHDDENVDPVNWRRRGGYARKGRDAVQCVYAITRLRALVVHKQCGHITYRWPAPAVLLLCVRIYSY